MIVTKRYSRSYYHPGTLLVCWDAERIHYAAGRLKLYDRSFRSSTVLALTPRPIIVNDRYTRAEERDTVLPYLRVHRGYQRSWHDTPVAEANPDWMTPCSFNETNLPKRPYTFQRLIRLLRA